MWSIVLSNEHRVRCSNAGNEGYAMMERSCSLELRHRRKLRGWCCRVETLVFTRGCIQNRRLSRRQKSRWAVTSDLPFLGVTKRDRSCRGMTTTLVSPQRFNGESSLHPQPERAVGETARLERQGSTRDCYLWVVRDYSETTPKTGGQRHLNRQESRDKGASPFFNLIHYTTLLFHFTSQCSCLLHYHPSNLLASRYNTAPCRVVRFIPRQIDTSRLVQTESTCDTPSTQKGKIPPAIIAHSPYVCSPRDLNSLHSSYLQRLCE